MDFTKKHKIVIIIILSIILSIILLVVSLTAWIKLIDKDKDVEVEDVPLVDVGNVNNVQAVESRLDYKMKIRQSYLLTYTTNKSAIWYMSSAKVGKIKEEDNISYISVTNEENTHRMILEIESQRVNVKKGDLINFVGTIDLETGNIELAKLSKDTINYSNVTKIEFTELVDNIKLVKNNIFVISGYMITDKDKFKLFESKLAFEDDSSVGRYFYITWKDKFNYTGNANVTLECNINGTYKLNNCVLVK